MRTKTEANRVKRLKDVVENGKSVTFPDRLNAFSQYMHKLRTVDHVTYLREILSPSDREVLIRDPFTGEERTMLLFASNNYLNLSNHPHVIEAVQSGVKKFGVGLGGPPLLNGYTNLMRELEQRLSAQKGKEDTLIFSSGYQANIGLAASLPGPNDNFFFDELHHASFIDGSRLGRGLFHRFPHNDTERLQSLLSDIKDPSNTTSFVAVEGVYSMDGDLCLLPQFVRLCKEHKAILVLDDAHGGGVLGKSGGGTAEHFGLEDEVDIIMGTFSKAFAMSGGYVSATRDIVQYLRFLARPHMFSAALPPASLLALLASMDVIEKEPERRDALRKNVSYLCDLLEDFSLVSKPEAAIISVPVPAWMDIRAANYLLHQNGFFVNAIEPPAVSEGGERFRISVMVNHTRDDLDRLAEAMHNAWNDPAIMK